jgi:hypothetical protein
MRALFGWWSVSAVVVLSMTVAGEAHAGYRCECAGSDRWSHPGADADGVPINARVFVSWLGLDVESLELQTAAPGNAEGAVAVASETLPTDGLPHQVVVVPEAPLLPDRLYWLAGRVGGASERTRLLTFRTGDEADEDPPRVGGVAAGSVAEICERYVGGGISVSDFEDNGRTVPNELLFRLEFSDDGVGEALSLYLSNRYGPMVFGAFSSNARSPSRDCLFPMAGVTAGTRRLARVVAIDWAGNETRLPEPLEIEFSLSDLSGGAGGCSVAGTGPSSRGLLWLVACLAPLFIGTRRRSGRKMAPSRLRRWARLALAVALTLVPVVGCSGGSGSRSAGDTGGQDVVDDRAEADHDTTSATPDVPQDPAVDALADAGPTGSFAGAWLLLGPWGCGVVLEQQGSVVTGTHYDFEEGTTTSIRDDEATEDTFSFSLTGAQGARWFTLDRLGANFLDGTLYDEDMQSEEAFGAVRTRAEVVQACHTGGTLSGLGDGWLRRYGLVPSCGLTLVQSGDSLSGAAHGQALDAPLAVSGSVAGATVSLSFTEPGDVLVTLDLENESGVMLSGWGTRGDDEPFDVGYLRVLPAAVEECPHLDFPWLE